MQAPSYKLDFQTNHKPAERTYSLPNKLLLSAGPTNCSPRVLAALSNNWTGSLCDELYQMKDEIKELLKYAFQTKNEVTLVLQNAGTGGLEAAVANLVDPGEKIIIACGGIWGDRTVETAKARNIDVIKLTSEPGEVFTFEELEEQIIKHKPVLLFITHGESSGGTVQPLDGLGDICHKYNCLFAVDAVMTIGGVPFFADRWGVDCAVAATQKPIGAPPGMSPITFSTKAVERMKSLKTSPPFYVDILRLGSSWGCFGGPRKHHYTYNSHMLCAVREALASIAEEGLENRWERHRKIAESFCKGMEKLGLVNFVKKPENRLWTTNLFEIPVDVKWPVLLDHLAEKYQVVIGFGLGPSTNRAMRVGIMGYNARPEVVDYLLEVLDATLKFCRSDAGKNGESTRSAVV